MGYYVRWGNGDSVLGAFECRETPSSDVLDEGSIGGDGKGSGGVYIRQFGIWDRRDLAVWRYGFFVLLWFWYERCLLS